MSFNSGLEIGDNISNNEIKEIFKCSNQGGMRRSLETGTLVIISDHTKGLYQDKWEEGILYYTGMGQTGDQVLNGNQNKTLYYSDTNGVEVHLFEVVKKSVYTYRGIMKLESKPYRDKQVDVYGNMRMVWMFPLKAVSALESSINEFNIPETRLIPMSSSEFEDYNTFEEVQNKFFLEELITRERCAYKYREKGLKSQNNALLLFQYNNTIIASARLDEVVAFEDTEDGVYRGAYYLYPDSIQVFEPITLRDFKIVCPSFIGFSQTKRYIEINCLNAILKLIELKSQNYELSIKSKEVVEDIAEKEAKQLSNKELLKRINNNKMPKITYRNKITTYPRDSNLKELIKRLADGNCQLCGQAAPFKDKSGSPYLEEHHVIRLADGGKDELANVVTLCPNCHRKIHILNVNTDKKTLEEAINQNIEKSKLF